MGLNYIWNARLNGRKLAEIAEPGKTWLMMDFVVAGEWLCRNGIAGHRGAVNVLYADGTVRCTWPFADSPEKGVWKREFDSLTPWAQWAKE